MEFRILGPLEVLEHGRQVDVGGAKHRALLTVLLLDANRVVSRDRLLEALWEDRPPKTAAKALQVYVSQLRKALGRERIATRSPGYLIRVDAGELDLESVERLREGGAVAAALAVWRGPPLAEFARMRFARAEIERLEELRLICLEERIDADLVAGRHAELVGEVEALVAEHPLRGRLRGQLMLALYRSGRQAEALASYQEARSVLVEQLGLEPGRDLRELEGAILRQEPALDLVAALAPEARTPEQAPELPPIPEQRKVVSVLFADLVGFTSRAETLDPEDVREILSRWYSCVRGEVERFGGGVEKFVGDAVMGLFGAPVARGDDPERAVRAALAVRESARRLNAEEPGLALRFRIGVNTGEALVAPTARALQGEGMVVGDVVNAAARLQAAAPADGILVGEETYRATRVSIVYEEIGPIVAKGKERPLQAWSATEARSAQPERPLLGASIVGRDSELDLLAGIWERVVAERRPRLVTIFAPPGIGKTRLAREFGSRVESQAGRVIEGRSVPYGEGAVLGPFARQVKQLAGIFDSDPVPLARTKLEHAVRVIVGEGGEEICAPLAVLIGLAPASAESDRQVSFYAARRLVEALAADRPAMLLFEDVHWADQPDLDLVEYLASRIRDVPLLLVALARPDLLERRPHWGGGPASTGISLEPLELEESRELAARLLGQRSASAAPEVVQRLAETAEGNPLFIEELVAALAERPRETVQELPTNVRGIIAARIDALPADERSILLDASILGRSFWRGAVERPGERGRLSASLDSIERRDLIRRQPVSRIEGEQEFLFKHALIREVAYATLPRAVRRERHAAAARFIEQATAERVAEWAPILAQHWREAGEPARELDHLVSAAERAWPAEALSLYTRALELIGEGDEPRRRMLLLRRAAVLVEDGQYRDAARELDALLPELSGRERFEAVRARGQATFWQFDGPGARAYGEEALRLAEELGEEDLQALALSFLSTVGSMEGKLGDAIALHERALSRWRPGSHRYELGDAQGWLALQYYWAGRYVPALECARQAHDIGLELDSPLMVASADTGLALAGLGRHEEALQSFADANALLREVESRPLLTSRLLNVWGGTLRELGALDEARSLHEEAVELASGIEFTGAVVSGRVDLLFCDLASGDEGRAAVDLPDLLRLAEETPGWHQWIWLIRLALAKAQVELARGRPEDAAASAQAALERAARHGRRKYVVAARRALASAHLELGRARQAADILQRCVADAEELGHPPSLIAAAGLLGEALLTLGDDAEAAFLAAKVALDSFTGGLAEERRALFVRTPPAAAVLAAVG